MPWQQNQDGTWSQLEDGPPKATAPQMGGGEAFLRGVGHGLYGIYKGVEQAGAELGEKVGLVSPATVQRITQEGMEADREFAPLAEQSFPARAGEFWGGAVPIPFIPGGAKGGALRRAGTSALAGGALGAARFVPEGEDRSVSTAVGAGLGGAVSLGLSGAGKLVNGMMGRAPKSAIRVEADKHGVPLSLGEETGNAALQRTETLLERVPGVFGLRKFREKQQKAAQQAATDFFSKYTVNPSAGSTEAMKAANDAALDGMYDAVRQSGAALPRVEAGETRSAAVNVLQRFKPIFESVQDGNVKKVLQDIAGDTADQTVKTGVLNAQGKMITRKVTPTFDFGTLWELRKGIGKEMQDARTETARGVFKDLYRAVSEDMDTMFQKGGGATGQAFKAANEAWKQYSLKFDIMRQAYDKAMGTTKAGEMFSPKKFSTELKNLANDPQYKKNVKWNPTEVQEMTGLANVLQVVKRAGQYAENPPTGNRWGPTGIVGGLLGGTAYTGGLETAATAAATGGSVALIAKFLTTTARGKSLVLAASRFEPQSVAMQRVVSEVYRNLPKFAAQYGTDQKAQ